MGGPARLDTTDPTVSAGGEAKCATGNIAARWHACAAVHTSGATSALSGLGETLQQWLLGVEPCPQSTAQQMSRAACVAAKAQHNAA